MLKKIDEAMNWVLVFLFSFLAIYGLYCMPAAAFVLVGIIAIAVIIRAILNKKNKNIKNNVIQFERKE